MADQPTQDAGAPVDIEKAAFIAFMPDFIKETDRAAVVLGVAKIDALLSSLIEKVLLPHAGSEDDLLEGDAPLATFSARIRAAYRLGIVDAEMARLLHVLRKLRNTFAHEISQSSLSGGSAKDRVIALCSPFEKAPFYTSLVRVIAKEMSRDVHDTGVLFRTVLTMFYVYLSRIGASVRRITPASAETFVERIHKRKALRTS